MLQKQKKRANQKKKKVHRRNNMVREMACRKCKFVTVGKVCPVCKSSDLTPDWQGVVLIVNPEGSRIASTLGISVKGKYALKVT